MIETIRWQPVRAFVRARLAGVGPVPTAGSADWAELPDDDPAKLAAVLTAGSRWALEAELAQIHHRAAAMKAAAEEAAAALPWAAVGKRIADRDAWRRAHPDLERKAS